MRAFRSLLLPLKAVLLNLLSVAAAYGMLVVFFRFGVGQSLLGLYQFDQIEGWIPIFLFAMLFGLSMDYEVFLVTRMREAWDEGDDNETAVAHGLERTGRIITAAAIIMCAAFSGFLAGNIVGLQEFGLGLAVAIFVDATIVRAHPRPEHDGDPRPLELVAARRRSPGSCASRAVRLDPRRCSIASAMKGLICAGGTATRLEELTRITNKHLLPVGRWPMVYYPLQLLQRVGVGEVLLVTGKQHAGDFIDLLGDGRVRSRSGDEVLFDLDLSYKVQVEPGGIAQVVGMAHDFARGEKLVVCLGDNIFENAQVDAIAAWDDGAMVFVSEVDDPVSFGVVAYDDEGGVADIVEKAGVVDMRYAEPPSSDAVVGLYCYPPDVSRSSARSSRRAAASSRSPTSTAPTPGGELSVRRVEGWWHDGGKHWGDLAEVGRLIEETGANK